MIKIIDGDLLASKTDIIAHQVNCKGAFNSGVARAIREYDVQVSMIIVRTATVKRQMIL